MKLHQNPQLFDQAIRATAKQKQLQEIYIEKDYWVTYALHTIFKHEIGNQTVFKGGTALSKCYGLIERLSEDIDLVVANSGDENDNQLKKKIKTITNVVSEILPETYVDGVTHKIGMIRKTAHSYPKQYKGDFGQVRDVIVVEATWLGYFEPYTTKTINSFIYEMMMKSGQQVMAQEYDLLPFNVQVLDTRRTICEKIMALVRFSYTENPIFDLRSKVRHTYDLHQLLKQNEFQNFINSSDFDSMLLRVAHDDVASFKNNSQWLEHHPANALIFADLENTWGQIKNEYSTTFKDLVFGSLPEEIQILESLQFIKERLTKVEWSIINH